jgi:hypothetical protein
VVLASNALVLGAPNSACPVINANTNVGIDVGNPSNILTVLRVEAMPSAMAGIPTARADGRATVSNDLNDSGKREIGVSAEEVGQVVPEVVSDEENGKHAHGVDYSRLTAL